MKADQAHIRQLVMKNLIKGKKTTFYDQTIRSLSGNILPSLTQQVLNILIASNSSLAAKVATDQVNKIKAHPKLTHQVNYLQTFIQASPRPCERRLEYPCMKVEMDQKMQQQLELPKLDMKSQSTFNVELDQDDYDDKEYELKCIQMFCEREEQSMQNILKSGWQDHEPNLF